jgi:hypothetical protein
MFYYIHTILLIVPVIYINLYNNISSLSLLFCTSSAVNIIRLPYFWHRLLQMRVLLRYRFGDLYGDGDDSSDRGDSDDELGTVSIPRISFTAIY